MINGFAILFFKQQLIIGKSNLEKRPCESSLYKTTLKTHKSNNTNVTILNNDSTKLVSSLTYYSYLKVPFCIIHGLFLV